jgi:hypothetical protein
VIRFVRGPAEQNAREPRWGLGAEITSPRYDDSFLLWSTTLCLSRGQMFVRHLCYGVFRPYVCACCCIPSRLPPLWPHSKKSSRTRTLAPLLCGLELATCSGGPHQQVTLHEKQSGIQSPYLAEEGRTK